MDPKKIQKYIDVLDCILAEDVTACSDCPGRDKCALGHNDLCKHFTLIDLQNDLKTMQG